MLYILCFAIFFPALCHSESQPVELVAIDPFQSAPKESYSFLSDLSIDTNAPKLCPSEDLIRVAEAENSLDVSMRFEYTISYGISNDPKQETVRLIRNDLITKGIQKDIWKREDSDTWFPKLRQLSKIIDVPPFTKTTILQLQAKCLGYTVYAQDLIYN